MILFEIYGNATALGFATRLSLKIKMDTSCSMELQNVSCFNNCQGYFSHCVQKMVTGTTKCVSISNLPLFIYLFAILAI